MTAATDVRIARAVNPRGRRDRASRRDRQRQLRTIRGVKIRRLILRRGGGRSARPVVTIPKEEIVTNSIDDAVAVHSFFPGGIKPLDSDHDAPTDDHGDARQDARKKIGKHHRELLGFGIQCLEVPEEGAKTTAKDVDQILETRRVLELQFLGIAPPTVEPVKNTDDEPHQPYERIEHVR